MAARWGALVMSVSLAGACTMDFDEFVHGSANTCTPNEARPCVGPGACNGTQVCAADGLSLGPCVCGSGGSGGDGGAAPGGGGAVPGGGGAGQGGSGGQ